MFMRLWFFFFFAEVYFSNLSLTYAIVLTYQFSRKDVDVTKKKFDEQNSPKKMRR